MSRDPNKLDAFRLADELALLTYEETRTWSQLDRDGIRSQLRRAAISSAVNIIEGCARRSKADYARFLDIALGSASEANYLINFSARVGLLGRESHERCAYLSIRVVIKRCRNYLTPLLCSPDDAALGWSGRGRLP